MFASISDYEQFQPAFLSGGCRCSVVLIRSGHRKHRSRKMNGFTVHLLFLLVFNVAIREPRRVRETESPFNELDLMNEEKNLSF